MRLDPDQDALDFGASVRDLLADSADSAALRAAWDSDDGRIPGLWKRLADVGVLGSTIPADLGGLGLDARSVLPVLIESGRAALPEPLIETLVGSSLLAAVGGALAPAGCRGWRGDCGGPGPGRAGQRRAVG
jgi:alkylation response protein AidB-like acyl-CoA dehydrogenase